MKPPSNWISTVIAGLALMATIVNAFVAHSSYLLSSTFRIFIRTGHVITQKISSYAMKPSASSIDKTVRPNGPVGVHRFFQSDQ